MPEAHAFGLRHRPAQHAQQGDLDRPCVRPQRHRHRGHGRARRRRSAARVRSEALEHARLAQRLVRRLLDDRDPHALDAARRAARRTRSARGRARTHCGSRPSWPDMTSVARGHELERAGDGAREVDRVVHVADAVGGDQPVRGLEADRPAERGGDARRAALVDADGQVDLRRRRPPPPSPPTSRRPTASCRTGSARDRRSCAHRCPTAAKSSRLSLPTMRAAGVEQPLDDHGVGVGTPVTVREALVIGTPATARCCP